MNHELPKVVAGLMWHSMNSDNLGVGALTLANISILEDAAKLAGVKLHFLVIGWSDPTPHYFERDDIENVGLRMKDFVRPSGGLYHHLRRCDLVLDIGAGDSFADIYGSKRFATILASKVLTKLARKPLLLCPQTIGPFRNRLARRLALMVLNRSDIVATRDDLSTQFLRSMGVRHDPIEASDVALRLPYAIAERKTPAATTRVGLNVSGLLYNGGYTRQNMFGLRDSYPQTIRDILTWLAEDGSYEVHLVPHVVSDLSEVEDDHRANLKLAAEFPGVVLAPKFRDPVAAKSYIAGMDFFCGARMHACIAAFSSGVPVLPMAYSRKFAGLFGSLGYDTLADCRSDGRADILEKFKAALLNRDELGMQIAHSLDTGLKRLKSYEDAVTRSLSAFTR